MAGGLMQLVAYGAQDVYITGKPEITFFKIMYKRHTNFAVESMEQTFTGTFNFGRKATCEISRNGDLVTDCILNVRLPQVEYTGDFCNMGHVSFAWVPFVGYAMLKEVELEIGGSTIDKHYGDWLQIWDEVSHSVGHRRGLDAMLGNVPALTDVSSLSWKSDNNVLKEAYDLWVPLEFYFNQRPGLALPLIALQYHQVKIHVTFRPARECYISSQAFDNGTQNVAIENASIYVGYVFLDTDERRRFAQMSHEYLIEQLQWSEDAIGNQNSGKFKLNFNHPVRALYWHVKLGNYLGHKFMAYNYNDWEQAREDAAKTLLLAQYDVNNFGYLNPVSGSSYVGENGAEYEAVNPSSVAEEQNFDFDTAATASHFSGTSVGRLDATCSLVKLGNVDLRDKVSGVITIHRDASVCDSDCYYLEVSEVTVNNLTFSDLSIPVDKYEEDNRSHFSQEGDLTLWLHHNHGLLINGTVNPVSQVELQLNGQSRQSKRSGAWHDTVEHYLHHSNTPKAGINIFPFGLDLEEHQPTGTCNMSRIDNAHLLLTFAFNEHAGGRYSSLFMDSDNHVQFFVRNYNVARMISGMYGLAYAN
jgi:hypothetical protein